MIRAELSPPYLVEKFLSSPNIGEPWILQRALSFQYSEYCRIAPLGRQFCNILKILQGNCRMYKVGAENLRLCNKRKSTKWVPVGKKKLEKVLYLNHKISFWHNYCILLNSNNPVSVDGFIFWRTFKFILKIRWEIYHKVNVTCNIFPKTIFVYKLLPSATDCFNRNHVILLLVYCTSQYHSKNILFRLQIFGWT